MDSSFGYKTWETVCATVDYDSLDVHGSVRHNINHTEITNKMQPCTRIYYSNVY